MYRAGGLACAETQKILAARVAHESVSQSMGELACRHLRRLERRFLLIMKCGTVWMVWGRRVDGWREDGFRQLGVAEETEAV